MGRETNNTNRPEEIFDSIRDRLIDQITLATTHNTYVSTLPSETPASAADVLYEISPGQDVTFDYPEIVGAGQSQVSTKMQMMVTIHIATDRDQEGRDDEYLKASDIGAFVLVRDVLKALCAWDPLDSSSNEQLSQPMIPTRAYFPAKDDREVGYVTIVFDMEFDWDMS